LNLLGVRLLTGSGQYQVPELDTVHSSTVFFIFKARK